MQDLPGKSALIVEDELIVALDLKSTLKTWGFGKVDIVGTGAKALSYIESNFPSLVLLDIILADNISGIDIAKILKKKEIPFMFLSAFSNPENYNSAKELNPLAIVKKPFREDILRKTIAKF